MKKFLLAILALALCTALSYGIVYFVNKDKKENPAVDTFKIEESFNRNIWDEYSVDTFRLVNDTCFDETENGTIAIENRKVMFKNFRGIEEAEAKGINGTPSVIGRFDASLSADTFNVVVLTEEGELYLSVLPIDDKATNTCGLSNNDHEKFITFKKVDSSKRIKKIEIKELSFNEQSITVDLFATTEDNEIRLVEFNLSDNIEGETQYLVSASLGDTYDIIKNQTQY